MYGEIPVNKLRLKSKTSSLLKLDKSTTSEEGESVNNIFKMAYRQIINRNSISIATYFSFEIKPNFLLVTGRRS
jgi:hypothetical protein